jgi:L-ascorbate metabolism protein UlaG (beta-lactamase superfamily)
MPSSRWLSPLLVGLVVAATMLWLRGPAAPPSARAQAATVKLEWLGWSFFRLTSPGGKVVLLNPWIRGNPAATVSIDDITQANIIIAADGHGDEFGQTIDLALKTGAFAIAPGELSSYLLEKGVPTAQVARFATPGDRLIKDGITVRVLNSVHGSGLSEPTAKVPYGGPAGSFMITFENGYTIYFEGSSAATMDMQLWGSMYKPDAMIYHMGTNHDPLDIAMAIKLISTDNPNLKTLMPHHHTPDLPPGWTSVPDVQAALGQLGINTPITNQVRSQVYELSK